MAERKREEVFSTLSTFAVLLIIFLHAFPSLDLNNSSLAVRALVRTRLFVDELPVYLFVIISGYMFALTTPAGKEIRYFDFLYKKAKRLLLPYVALSALAFPIKCLLSRFAYRPVDFSFMAYMKSLIYPSTNTIYFFWYLPTLFGAFLAAPALLKIYRSPRKAVLAPVAGVLLAALYLFNPAKHILLFNIGKACDFLFFFWAGMLYCSVRDARIPYRSYIAAACFGLLVVLRIAPGGGRMEQLAAILCCAFATHYLATIYVARKMRVFDFMDGFSYPIYLLSWFPIVFIRILLVQKLGADFLVTFAALYLGGLFISLAMAKIVLRYLPRAKSVIGM